jgi:hypothetical protein
VDSQLLTTAKDVGGWVFACVFIASVSFVVIRWQMGLLERQTAATEKMADAVNRLTDEVRASRRR